MISEHELNEMKLLAHEWIEGLYPGKGEDDIEEYEYVLADFFAWVEAKYVEPVVEPAAMSSIEELVARIKKECGVELRVGDTPFGYTITMGWMELLKIGRQVADDSEELRKAYSILRCQLSSRYHTDERIGDGEPRSISVELNCNRCNYPAKASFKPRVTCTVCGSESMRPKAGVFWSDGAPDRVVTSDEPRALTSVKDLVARAKAEYGAELEVEEMSFGYAIEIEGRPLCSIGRLMADDPRSLESAYGFIMGELFKGVSVKASDEAVCWCGEDSCVSHTFSNS